MRVLSFLLRPVFPATIKLNERQIKELAELKEQQDAVGSIWSQLQVLQEN